MKHKLLIYLILLSFITICFCISRYHYFCHQRVLLTKLDLGGVRQKIRWFKEIEGRNPSSINELRVHFKTTFESNDLNELRIDFNLKPQHEIKEYSILNDLGGYYYDSNTGEVRVNLTKPVKYYLRFYFGKERNDIPADW